MTDDVIGGAIRRNAVAESHVVPGVKACVVGHVDAHSQGCEQFRGLIFNCLSGSLCEVVSVEIDKVVIVDAEYRIESVELVPDGLRDCARPLRSTMAARGRCVQG